MRGVHDRTVATVRIGEKPSFDKILPDLTSASLLLSGGEFISTLEDTLYSGAGEPEFGFTNG
jgi:hypothetical protein